MSFLTYRTLIAAGGQTEGSTDLSRTPLEP